jgi:hypothetical protein
MARFGRALRQDLRRIGEFRSIRASLLALHRSEPVSPSRPGRHFGDIRSILAKLRAGRSSGSSRSASRGHYFGIVRSIREAMTSERRFRAVLPVIPPFHIGTIRNDRRYRAPCFGNFLYNRGFASRYFGIVRSIRSSASPYFGYSLYIGRFGTLYLGIGRSIGPQTPIHFGFCLCNRLRGSSTRLARWPEPRAATHYFGHFLSIRAVRSGEPENMADELPFVSHHFGLSLFERSVSATGRGPRLSGRPTS